MRHYFSLKTIWIPTISALAGGLVTATAIKASALIQNSRATRLANMGASSMGPYPSMDGFFENDFFFSQDPFEEFRKIQDRMHLQMREDEGYVYFEIPVEDIKSTSIRTRVERGHLTITGETSRSNFQSRFQKTLPLPDGLDEKRMETVPEEGKIILKFPKLKV